MKDYLYAFSMCQSMFCSIPFPCHVWEEKARSKMLLFLPVIGLEIGFLWAFLGWLLSLTGWPTPLCSAILTIYPFLCTGFIHLDGFMDVTDAVGSCRDLEKRRAILKDSHVGAFAVIGCILLMLFQFACFLSVRPGQSLWILVLVPAVTRTCSALAVDGLPSMSTSQYAGRKKQTAHMACFWCMLALLLAAGFLFFGIMGLMELLFVIFWQSLALRKGYHSLQGMNGDISGYSITIGELAAVASLVIF